MNLNRRAVLGGLAAATFSGGAVFGSGAYTSVSADRSFTVGLADNDASSQLVVEENDEIDSSAVTTDENGVFEIDSSGISPSATVGYGSFDDISADQPTLQTGIFVIRNENDTGSPVDISVDIGYDEGTNPLIELFVIEADGEGADSTDTTADSTSATISDVPANETTDTDAGSEVECGFIVDSDTSETLDPNLTISATLSSETT